MKKRTCIPGYSKVCKRIEELLSNPQIATDQKTALSNILRNTLRNGRIQNENQQLANILRTDVSLPYFTNMFSPVKPVPVAPEAV